MTQIDLSKLIFHSSFSGFGNYTNATISFSVASRVVGSSPAVLVTSTPISNANSVSQTEVRLTNLDAVLYIFKGHLQNFYTSGNVWTNNVSLADYEIDIDTSYTTTSLVLTVSIYKLSASPTVSTPAFVVDCNASLYLAPF